MSETKQHAPLTHTTPIVIMDATVTVDDGSLVSNGNTNTLVRAIHVAVESIILPAITCIRALVHGCDTSVVRCDTHIKGEIYGRMLSHVLLPVSPTSCISSLNPSVTVLLSREIIACYLVYTNFKICAC